MSLKDNIIDLANTMEMLLDVISSNYKGQNNKQLRYGLMTDAKRAIKDIRAQLPPGELGCMEELDAMHHALREMVGRMTRPLTLQGQLRLQDNAEAFLAYFEPEYLDPSMHRKYPERDEDDKLLFPSPLREEEITCKAHREKVLERYRIWTRAREIYQRERANAAAERSLRGHKAPGSDAPPKVAEEGEGAAF